MSSPQTSFDRFGFKSEFALEQCGFERLIPTIGTNYTTVFGEDVLETLKLTEEELENLGLLINLPSDEGSNFDKGLEKFKEKYKVANETIEIMGNLKRHLSKRKLDTLYKLSITEKQAGENFQCFRTFSMNLHSRMSAIGPSIRSEFHNLLDVMERLANFCDCERYYIAYANMFLSVDQCSKEDIDTLDTLVREYAGQQSTIGEGFATLPVLSKIYKFPSKESLLKHVQKLLKSNYDILTGEQCNAELAFCKLLLLGDSDPSLLQQEIERKYLQLSHIAIQNGIATPIEFIAHNSVSTMFYQYSALAFMAYTTSMLVASLSEERGINDMWSLTTCFRQFCRMQELFGVPYAPIHGLFEEAIESIFPQVSDSDAFSQLSEQDILTSSGPLLTTVWSAALSKRPWLPTQAVKQSATLNLQGPFGGVKCDTVLSQVSSAEYWTIWKWLGMSRSTIENLTPTQLMELIEPGFGVGMIWRSLIGSEFVKSFSNSLSQSHDISQTTRTRFNLSCFVVSKLSTQFWLNRQKSYTGALLPDLTLDGGGWDSWD